MNYRVICDETNNSPDDQAQGKLNVDLTIPYSDEEVIINVGLIARKVYNIRTKKKRIVRKYVKRFLSNGELAEYIIRNWK